MTASANISVIIPVHNNARTLVDQLDGVARGLTAGLTAEVIVVDNRSTDGSGDIARAWAERSGVDLKVVKADEFANEPYARNVGIAAATAEFLAFCDGDDVVSESWLMAVTTGLTEHDYVTGPVDTTRLNPLWLRDVRGQRLLTERPLLYGRIPFAHGCNIGIRSRILNELGGFDQKFSIGCDIDLAIRAWKSGVALAFLPGAEVHYRLRSSMRDLYRQGRSYGRIRPMVRAALIGVVDTGGEWRNLLRRVAWLVLRLPLVGSRPTRAKWIWLLAQIDGELRGHISANRQ